MASDPRMARPAVRWVLLLATAVLLVPPGSGARAGMVDHFILGVFFASNLVLTFLPRARRNSPRLDYALVIADTFLVSTALFHSGLDGGRFVAVFFLVLLLSATGADLPRLLVGATLVAGVYLYLMSSQGGGGFATLATRVPFLYVVALYYGRLAIQVREQSDRQRRTEREKAELQAFLEVASATTSTLDLHQVLYVVAQRVARMVNALRCSIL
ncbi:MAG TPA: hypothetical protein VJV75_13600, partial [Candidatus Polarisedimenticolia bacterium]|nr:hypothetical protein [Candidatus Polarisedimenticolia bacterium]